MSLSWEQLEEGPVQGEPAAFFAQGRVLTWDTEPCEHKHAYINNGVHCAACLFGYIV